VDHAKQDESRLEAPAGSTQCHESPDAAQLRPRAVHQPNAGAHIGAARVSTLDRILGAADILQTIEAHVRERLHRSERPPEKDLQAAIDNTVRIYCANEISDVIEAAAHLVKHE
jgi:hypothetical protein